MTRLVWEPGLYEAGVEQGVLYPSNGHGEAWSGLISVQESPSDIGGDARYVDGHKIGNRRIVEDFAATIEAFTYPEWILNRRELGLSYRTRNKIHLIYNARIRMSDRTYKMQEHTPFSFDLTARPAIVPEAKRSAHLVIDTSKAYSHTLTALEDLLYGSEEQVPQLPSPTQIFEIFEVNSILRVIDHGDGSFTVEGPDDAIQVVDGEFTISWPSAVYVDEASYTIQSL
jgi:hypothetical protein